MNKQLFPTKVVLLSLLTLLPASIAIYEVNHHAQQQVNQKLFANIKVDYVQADLKLTALTNTKPDYQQNEQCSYWKRHVLRFLFLTPGTLHCTVGRYYYFQVKDYTSAQQLVPKLEDIMSRSFGDVQSAQSSFHLDHQGVDAQSGLPYFEYTNNAFNENPGACTFVLGYPTTQAFTSGPQAPANRAKDLLVLNTSCGGDSTTAYFPLQS